MLDRIITPADLLATIEELGRKQRIIGPVARQGRFFYQEVAHAAQLDLSFNCCVYSPRAFLLPPSDTLLTFENASATFTARPVIDRRPFALIGVHPCDLNAIQLLDRVFSMDHRDGHYLARRAAALIVGVDCPRPCTAGVFCADMHANESANGFDVMLIPLINGDRPHRYGVIFGTEDGRHWLLYSRRSTVPTIDDERALDDYRSAKSKAFSPALRTKMEDLPELLDRSYDSLLWEATARRCYSCGSCNLACPTCYCFNLRDEFNLDLKTGARIREWDGCQLRDFAEVAGGHNFRPRASSRLRHRIYRKAKWIRERTGLPGCVGCARCDRACTAKINSVDIYNQLAEAET